MKPKGNNNFIGGTYFNRPRVKSKSKRYSDLERIRTFRVGKPYQVIGYIFLAFSICLFFLMSASEYEIIKYFFAAFFAMIGIYFLLTFYILRVCLDDEKIVFYNIAGRKNELLWSDITSALVYLTHTRDSVQENIDIFSDTKKITIDKRFKNFTLIRSIITEKCRTAFPAGKIESGGTQVFRIDKNLDGIVFCFIVLGVIFAAAGIVACLQPDWEAITRYMGLSSLLILAGLVFLLLRLVSRVYIDAESITHINLFGVKKQIMWPEIEYVKFARSYLKLSGGGNKMIISGYFIGFEVIGDIIRKYCHEKATTSMLSSTGQ